MLGRLFDIICDIVLWIRDLDGWIEDFFWIFNFFFVGVYRKFM